MRTCMCINKIEKRAPQLLFDTFPWRHWQALKPDALALWHGDKKISWQQFAHDIDTESVRLSLYQGTTFALAGYNDYDTLIKMLAIWQLGKSSLLINPDFSSLFTHELIEHIGIDHLLQDARKTPSFCFPRTVSPFYLKERLKKVPYDPMRPLTLTLTSGSSGFPKAIVHNAKQHIASALGLFSRMRFEQKDVWLLSLPLYHISGLAIIWRWLVKGAGLKLAPTKGGHFLTAFDKVTHASLVPSQFFDLLEKNSQIFLRDLKTVLLGGTEIPLSLALKAEKKGIETWCGYGMTEMASTITVKRADSVFSVGQLLPYRHLRITPEGNIEVKGETLALGERRDGKLCALTKSTMTKNRIADSSWFETKDRGFWLRESKESIDKALINDRELVVSGRADNVFQSGGENVQPEMLESLLGKYAGIEAVLVIPVPDKRWGHIPVALVKGVIDKGQFLAWARRQLVNYLRPKAVFFIPDAFLSQGIKLPRAKLVQWGQAQWVFYQAEMITQKSPCASHA